MKNIIVAFDKNRGIGIKGQLPWMKSEMKADMRLFRHITTGGVVIMGRRTMESIGKPLPDRRNIVLTKNQTSVFDGFEVANSLEQAFLMAEQSEVEIFVIGGAEIYAQAINHVDRIYATELETTIDDIDAHFPEIHNLMWSKSVSKFYDNNETLDKYSFNVVIYNRVKEDFVNLDNARLDEQRAVMQSIAEAGVCPFCPENLALYHKSEILKTGEHWMLTYNQWPYDNTKLHLLAIAKYHATSLAGMQVGAAEELFDFLRWAEEHYAITFGGVCMRFGDIQKNGATVDHLHVHLIVPNENLSKDEKVRFKIS